jgi:hypothetical protein
VLGAMSAARRLAARAAWLELAAVAEFTRRRDAQLAAATARKCRAAAGTGSSPAPSWAWSWSPRRAPPATPWTWLLTWERGCPAPGPRWPPGVIDEYRARLIRRPTRPLSDADAGRADEVLAALAAGLRYDQLARKAAAVAMKLDPDAFTRGKDKARAGRQRVVAGREESGDAFLSGRELAIADALASKAHIDALAVALRKGGLPGTLQQLRVVAFNDLTQGRDLAPPCRRHHRVKQAPGWTLTQPEPGIMHWQTPAGRGYTTRPTVYEM